MLPFLQFGYHVEIGCWNLDSVVAHREIPICARQMAGTLGNIRMWERWPISLKYPW